jgi:small subunit ribosomal protein S7
MPRKSRATLRTIEPDKKYDNVLLSRFIGKLMLDGKRTLAEKIIYDALEEAAKKTGKEPIELFETALKNVSPAVEVRARRVGGSTYQVPIEVSPRRRTQLAIRWIVDAARNKQGSPMSTRLANELASAVSEEGDAMKKKEDVHKMAEANRAFAHFARY